MPRRQGACQFGGRGRHRGEREIPEPGEIRRQRDKLDQTPCGTRAAGADDDSHCGEKEEPPIGAEIAEPGFEGMIASLQTRRANNRHSAFRMSRCKPNRCDLCEDGDGEG